MLTSLTTFIGLVPIVFFEKSMQAQIVIPMAVSLSFGVLFATVVTLILIPILYIIIEDIRGIFTRRKNRRIDNTLAASEGKLDVATTNMASDSSTE